MGEIRQWAILANVIASLFIQGCAFTPEVQDHAAQQAAIKRWNGCMSRFDLNTEHYCDGHRRDVLATYPNHLANQVNSLLSQQTRVNRASRLLKTGLGQPVLQARRGVRNTPIEAGSKAR